MGIDEGPSVGTDDGPGLAEGLADELDKGWADGAWLDEGRALGRMTERGVPRDLRNWRDAGLRLRCCELSSTRALRAGDEAGSHTVRHTGDEAGRQSYMQAGNEATRQQGSKATWQQGRRPGRRPGRRATTSAGR